MTEPRTELPLTEKHTCTCGEEHAQDLPELDARVIPHTIRHASVLGALDSLRPGSGMVLVAHHDPLPLLDQARARYGDALQVDYLERGPDAWKLRFLRVG